jgi:hypothetical protein
MKINEIVSEAPFVKALKSFPAQATKAIKNLPNQIKQDTKNFLTGKMPQGKVDYRDTLSKAFAKMGGGGAGLVNYDSGVSDPKKYDNFLSIITAKNNKAKDITNAMTNLVTKGINQKDKDTVVQAIKTLYQNEPGVTLADLNDQYGDVLSKLDIASKDIPQPSRTIGTPATSRPAAAKPPGTSVDPAQGNLNLK